MYKCVYGNVTINLSCFAYFKDNQLIHLRNHPYLVNHITELLPVWRANIEAKAVTSWDQLVRYILKYTLKPEEKSTTLSAIFKQVLDKTAEEAPLRKVFQKILINTVSERDISRNEACLILHRDQYVKYSKSFRSVNLLGTKQILNSVEKDNEMAQDHTSWAELYSKRETNPGYIQLCANYGTTFHWRCHPKEISLREFVSNFNKDWKPLQNNQTFIPNLSSSMSVLYLCYSQHLQLKNLLRFQHSFDSFY